MSDSPYRVPAPRPPDPYLVAWCELRRRRIAVLATIPSGTIVATLTPRAAFSPVWLFCIGIGIAALQHHVENFRCPHCGRGFGAATSNGPFWRRHIFSTGRLCAHCGIAVGTPKSGSATTAV